MEDIAILDLNAPQIMTLPQNRADTMARGQGHICGGGIFAAPSLVEKCWGLCTHRSCLLELLAVGVRVRDKGQLLGNWSPWWASVVLPGQG